MSKRFSGTIDVDIRDSQPDCEPNLQPGSPNVLYIVLDDVGVSIRRWSISPARSTSTSSARRLR